ncbi:twin-arginine translocase TatA/TatE family subunit [Sphingobacterium sp. DN00404]|uniref:Sec-independent protein translocase protein TatA n=1 Tax=Sphingobacterium micropteri TaxID=2763501 RepID=A0ABR7YIX6_9SPHI|nr:twin-arginine translocase TatA/TatE family subunit [Sphingobacterium micropteri]MBD1431226.1 twin-arginine translocase TatA/TatE family subunit [Sphingobacterium micropteri]
MTLGFLNIGTQEMVLIVIVILLLFGGKKLPELARGLGRGIREFKDASDGIKREISDQINNFEKDLDVTVEDKPTTKTRSQTISEEINQQEEEGEESIGVEEETKKEFPKFSTPENTVQHHPGEQPSSGDEHYTYGYNDHFANEENGADTSEGAGAQTNTTASDEEQPRNV